MDPVLVEEADELRWLSGHWRADHRHTFSW